jgi:succinoglycan biosynthesis transport protein ExoP
LSIDLNKPTDSNLLGDLKLSDYLEIGRRRKWLLILAPLAGLLICLVVAHRMRNVYRAETTILVDSSQIPSGVVPSMVTTDISARLTTLQQQVLSPTRLKVLVETEGLYPDPNGKRTEEDIIRAVQKGISVDLANPGGGRMGSFRISYSSFHQSEVARIANHIAQMFIEENLQAREGQTLGTAKFLEDQLAETKRQLDETDAQLGAIKSQNIFDLPESKPYHVEALANLRSQMQSLQDKISQDQRDKAILQSMLISGDGPAPTIDVGSGLGGARSSPDQDQLQKLETKLSELRVRYGPAHPEVRRTQKEIEQLKKKIASTPQDNVATDQKPLLEQPKAAVPRNPVLQAQIEKLDEDVNRLSSQMAPIQSQIEAHTARLAQIPVFEQKLSRLQQDNDSLRKQYASLLDKKQAAEMSYALEVRQKAEKFVVLDAAQTPVNPIAPNRPMIGMAGLLGGLLVGFALAAAIEMNDETVRSEGEAARLVGKPVLSGIPHLVSAEERSRRVRRAAGMVACTVVGSLALGFLFSFVTGRFL